MPAQKDFRERNSHCQLSIHSADKSWHVIAALVMLANKGTTEQVGDQQWRAERSSAVWGSSLPQQTPAGSQPAGWGARLECCAWWHPPCAPALACPGLAASPAPLIGSCAWAQVLLHHLSSTEGTQVSHHFEAVTMSVLPWAWNRMEEEQRKKAFPKQPQIGDGLLLNSGFGLTNACDYKGGMKLTSPHWENSFEETALHSFGFFFSKSVTKWGLESQKIVLVMIPSICKE